MMKAMDETKPRYIAAVIGPLGPDRHPMSQPQPLLPPDVKRISCSIDITDYTKSGVDEAIGNRYWRCVDELAGQGANSISLSGFPIASQIGRAQLLALLEETTKRTGVFADAQAEATIDAMRHLGMRRIAIASRWSHELNDKLAAYLSSAGFEILAVTSVG